MPSLSQMDEQKVFCSISSKVSNNEFNKTLKRFENKEENINNERLTTYIAHYQILANFKISPPNKTRSRLKNKN